MRTITFVTGKGSPENLVCASSKHAVSIGYFPKAHEAHAQNIKSKLESIVPSRKAVERFAMQFGNDTVIATLFYTKDRAYIATRNSGYIFVKRGESLLLLAHGNVSGEGAIQKGDEYILTTRAFIDLVGGMDGFRFYFTSYSAHEVADMLAAYETSGEVHGFIALQEGKSESMNYHATKEIEEAVMLSETSKLSVPSSRTLANMVSSMKRHIYSVFSKWKALKIRGLYRRGIETIRVGARAGKNKVFSFFTQVRRRPRVFLVGALCALGILVVMPRIIGGFLQEQKAQSSSVEAVTQKTQEYITKAEELSFADIQSVEGVFKEVYAYIDGARENKQISQDQYANLQKLLNSKEREYLRIKSETPKEYLTLAVDDSEAKAIDAHEYGGIFYLLDADSGTIYAIDTTRRSYEKWQSNKYVGATNISASADYVYVLTKNDGIYAVTQTTSKRVIAKDKVWGRITDMQAYAGNIYILDAQRRGIYKYIGTGDGLEFGDIEPYLDIDTQETLTQTQAMAIDGSVYALGVDTVSKFTLGRQAEFRLIVPYKTLALTAIAASTESENMYIADSLHSTLFELTKDGLFEKQWRTPDMKVLAVSRVVSDSKDTVFIVTPQGVYTVSP